MNGGPILGPHDNERRKLLQSEDGPRSDGDCPWTGGPPEKWRTFAVPVFAYFQMDELLILQY